MVSSEPRHLRPPGLRHIVLPHWLAFQPKTSSQHRAAKPQPKGEGLASEYTKGEKTEFCALLPKLQVLWTYTGWNAEGRMMNDEKPQSLSNVCE